LIGMSLNVRQLHLFSATMFTGALRSGPGLLFVISTLLLTLITASIVLKPMDVMMDQAASHGVTPDPKQTMDGLVSFSSPMVTWLLSDRTDTKAGDPSTRMNDENAKHWTTYLLTDHPAPLSAVYLLLCFCLPFLIALGAFDQVSSDIQARRLRFLLPRCNRMTIYLGRAGGMTVFVAVALALVVIVVASYFAVTLSFYTPSQIIGWSLRCYLMLVVAALPSVAVCSLISACIPSSFGSLALCNLAFAAVPLVPLIAIASTGAHWMKVFYWLLPLPFQTQLFHYAPTHILLAVLGCLAYAAFYFTLGLTIFMRRDL
jgi:ABC-type transport system involved in multi-copper enzyme maturation permease subunit